MANPTFILTQFGLEAANVAFRNVDSEYADDPVGVSQLGTPVVDNLIFKAGSYEADGVTVNYEEVRIDAVVMVVDQSKNIVTTQVQGRAGTVKEYISEGDFTVSIKGVITSLSSKQYPRDEVLNLVEICKAPVAVSVASKFLTLFGIADVVITNYNFYQKQGNENSQNFQIECLSDTPIELQLDNESA